MIRRMRMIHGAAHGMRGNTLACCVSLSERIGRVYSSTAGGDDDAELEKRRARAQYLRENITRHREAYREGRPLISDAHYDGLYAELESIERDAPLLRSTASPTSLVDVPGGNDSSTSAVGWSGRMLGLQNAYSDDDLLRFSLRVRRWADDPAKRCNIEHAPCESGEDGGERVGIADSSTVPHTNASIVCETKYDGVAVRARYVGGELVGAFTRGDGQNGQDVLHRLRSLGCEGLPECVSSELTAARSSLEVRGEVLLAYKKEDIQDMETSSRNVVAGLLHRKSGGNEARKLVFLAYELLFEDNTVRDEQIACHHQRMEALERSEFLTCPSRRVCRTDEEMVEAVNTLKHSDIGTKRRVLLPHVGAHVDVDGAVLKVNHIPLRQAMGASSAARSPRWAIAYKFDAPETIALVEGVNWQVTRSGRAIPVARVEPVYLSGSTVTRATLHNAANLLALGVAAGCRVSLKRAGDVIPYISEVVSHAEEREFGARREENDDFGKGAWVCPCTNASLLVMKDDDAVHAYCEFPGCPERVIAFLQHFVTTLGVKGVSKQTLSVLYEEKLVSERVSSLLALGSRRSDLLQLPRWGEKRVDNVIRSIESSASRASLGDVLAALGIPSVGPSTARKIAQAVGSAENLLQCTSLEDIESHCGASGATAAALLDALSPANSSTALSPGDQLRDLIEVSGARASMLLEHNRSV